MKNSFRYTVLKKRDAPLVEAIDGSIAVIFQKVTALTIHSLLSDVYRTFV